MNVHFALIFGNVSIVQNRKGRFHQNSAGFKCCTSAVELYRTRDPGLEPLLPYTRTKKIRDLIV